MLIMTFLGPCTLHLAPYGSCVDIAGYSWIQLAIASYSWIQYKRTLKSLQLANHMLVTLLKSGLNIIAVNGIEQCVLVYPKGVGFG